MGYEYMLFGLMFSLLGWGLPLIVVVWLVMHFAGKRSRKNTNDPRTNPQWYLNPLLNSGDVLSQALHLVSFVYLLGVINLVNRMLPEPFEWQTLLMVWSILGLLYAMILKNVLLHLVGVIVFFGSVTWQLGEWSIEAKTSAQWVVPMLLWWCAAMYAMGTLWLQKKPWQRFYITHQVLSIVAALVLIFGLSTRIGLEALNSSQQSGGSIMLALSLVVSIIVIGGIAIGTLLFGYAQKTMHLYELLACGLFVLIGIILISSGPMRTYNDAQIAVYDPYRMISSDSLTMGGFFWSVVFNLGALLLPVGVMLTGVYRQERWRINTGAFAIFVICFVKYFDWFFTFMDRSMFFIFAGVLLLGLGYFLERLRRYVVQTQLVKK